jgi:hypothetical protein
VRVPIPLVILLCLAVVGGAWWYGTWNADFLTPPSESELAEIRARAAHALPATHYPEDAIAKAGETPAPPPPPAEEPKPVIELGDLESPPVLHEYADLANKGAAHLIDLAVLLETEGEFQRALLAWERVIDSAKPDETQTISATSAIKRLRPAIPAWNKDPASSIAITLQAGTGKKTTKLLKPVLEQAALEIEQASAGILKVKAAITAGKDRKADTGPAPVALWLAGPAKDSRSTEVLSFTVGSPESLTEEINKTVFQIICGYLTRAIQLTPPVAIEEGEKPLDALGSHITRRQWHDLGTVLNQPAPKDP